MNPGGGACSEPRSCHRTPAWATERDYVSKKKKSERPFGSSSHTEPFEPCPSPPPCSNLGWLSYGALKGDGILIVVNTVGAALQTLYILAYLHYCPRKVEALPWTHLSAARPALLAGQTLFPRRL